MEAIQEGFLALDRNGRVRRANDPMGKMLGCPTDDLIGKPLADLFPCLEHKDLDNLLSGRVGSLIDTGAGGNSNGGFTEGPYRLVAHAADQGGLEILVADLGKTMRLEAELAQLKATMALSQELLRHKNEELDRSLERMARVNEQLAALDELKSQFLSNTSHELRTPLSTIIGSLQLVREGMCDDRDEEKEYTGAALDAATRLLKVINEMLDSAKLSAGKMHFLIEDHSVSTLFEEIYCQLNPAAQEKNLRLEFSSSGGDELFFRADLEKAKQVLINVVSNSIQFTQTGGITILAGLDADEDTVHFLVKDTGVGIPPDRHQNIFDPFTRVEHVQSRRHEGAGLGLAITKNLVEMMGGHISLHSEGLGMGTEVRFSLPKGASGQSSSPADQDMVDDLQNELPMTF
jgi:signal transduction histidine kinase